MFCFCMNLLFKVNIFFPEEQIYLRQINHAMYIFLNTSTHTHTHTQRHTHTVITDLDLNSYIHKLH